MNEVKNNKNPLVSFIVPCYNTGNFIEETIESIFAQTYENIEVIIIDDGSTDDITKEILSKISDPRIRNLYQDNQGPAVARNHGIGAAMGKYIFTLDSDDLIAPTYIEKAVAILDAHTEVGYVTSWIQTFGNECSLWKTSKFLPKEALLQNFTAIASLFRKECWEKVGGYDLDITGYEDWDFWISIVEAGYLGEVIEEPLFFYRRRDSSLISTADKKRQVLLGKILQKHSVLFRANAEFLYIEKDKINTQLIVEIGLINRDMEKVQARIGDMHNEIQLKNNEIQQKAQVIIQKEQEIQQKAQEITQKEREIQQKEMELHEIRTSLRWIIPNYFYKLYKKRIKSHVPRFIFKMKNFALRIFFEILLKYNAIVKYCRLRKYYSLLKEEVACKEVYTLSIILNLHREGALAEKTIINLMDIVKYHKPFHLWHNVEIIAVLDNPDGLTTDIVNHYEDLFDKIEIVDYKDLGSSRNHGISVAKNNFILFADGDDLVSFNCLLELYRVTSDHYKELIQNDNESLSKLNYNQHIAVFHDTLVEFPCLYVQKYQNSNENIVNNSMFFHAYTSKIMCSRDVLLKNKIRENTPPYGSEDWDLNNQLMSLGVRYKVANYTLYYRRIKDSGMCVSHYNNKYIPRNSEIYSADFKNAFLPEGHRIDCVESSVPDSEIYSFGRLSSDIFINHKLFLKRYGEDELLIKSHEVGNFMYQAMGDTPQVKIYRKLLYFLKDRDFIFFGPRVVLGGADKLIVEYANSLLNTDRKPCLITTISPGERINQISIPHLDITSICPEWESLNIADQMHILVKAIMNSNIKVIHVVNSDIALKLVKYYKDVFDEYKVKTIVSFYCPDYDWINNKYHGFPVMYPEVLLNADVILSDNQYWYDYFKELAGQEFNYKKLFSPVGNYSVIKKQFSCNKKILWASRICNQKLIRVLHEICKKMPAYTFVIYGSKSEDSLAMEYFEKILKLKNVDYRGIYNDYSELNMEEFDVLLFTSKFEGIAFIRLDMISHNLPIITSDVGDSTEIFGNNYELLVKNIEDAEEYCKKIDEFYQNPKYHFDNMTAIRKEVMNKHDMNSFQESYINEIES